MRGALLFCLFAMGTAGLAACGGTSDPPPAVCPTNVPPPANQSAGQLSRTYSTTVRNLADHLKSLRDSERASFPDRQFSGRSDFRSYFITFADDSVCTATALRALSAPFANFEQADAALDSAVDAFISHTQAGRQAVALRNSTDYHTWYDGEDAKLNAVMDAANVITSGRRPFGP